MALFPGLTLAQAADRPFRVPWWLLVVILALITANGIDAFATLTRLPDYQQIGVPVSPLVKGAAAAAWAVVLLGLLLGLIRHRPAAFVWAAPLLTIHAVTGLLWEIIFVRSDYGRGRLVFAALLTVIVLAPVWWTTARKRWFAREYGEQLN
jgi:hypothetical protein